MVELRRNGAQGFSLFYTWVGINVMYSMYIVQYASCWRYAKKPEYQV